MEPNGATTVLHKINWAYGLAEYGSHVMSVIAALRTLEEIIDQNAPPGTEISYWGIVSLLLHVGTYGVLPDLPGDQFSNYYSPTTQTEQDEFGEQDSAYARLSALIRDSRDPFTMERGWDISLFEPDLYVTTPHTAPFYVDLGILAWEIEMWFTFNMNLERKGASELRVIMPSGDKVSGENINWSSTDATGLGLVLGLGGSATFWALPEPFRFEIFSGSVGALLKDNELKVFVSFGETIDIDTTDCDNANDAQQILNDDDDPDNDADLTDCAAAALDGKEIFSLPVPTIAPFVSGFAEVGKDNDNNLSYGDMKLATVVIDDEPSYGGAADNILAWESPGSGTPEGKVPPIGVACAAGSPPPVRI